MSSKSTPNYLWKININRIQCHLVLFGLWICLVALPLAASGDPLLAPGSPPWQLDIATLPDTTLQIVNPTTVCYHFGQVNIPAPQPITHVFILRNSSASSFTIDHILTSCGCTVASVQGATSNLLPLYVLPGQQFEVQVAVDTANILPGDIQRSVTVYEAGKKDPAATLLMSGRLVPSAAVSPPTESFGRVPYGAKPELPVSITVRTNNAPLTGTLRFTSTNPNLELTAATPAATVTGSPVLPTKQNGLASGPKTYTLCLVRQPALGDLAGTVFIQYIPAGNAPPEVIGSINVRGELYGPLSSSASNVLLQSSPGAPSVTQTITVYGDKPSDLEGLNLSTSTSAFTATVKAPDPTKAGKSAIPSRPSRSITLTYLPGSAPGLFRESLTISNSSNVRLTVPVVISNSAKAASPFVSKQ